MKAHESHVSSDKTWQCLQTCIIQKQVQLPSLLSMNKCSLFIVLNKGSTVIFFYLFSSLLTSFFFSTNLDDLSLQVNWISEGCSGWGRQ
jgi:hypothetical protein